MSGHHFKTFQIKTRLTIELDPDLKRQFNGKCAYQGKKMKEMIEYLINEYLKQPDMI